MALDNLISIQITEADVVQIKTGIDMINTALKDKVINLTPDERRQYGSIADRNKSLVDKCKDYMSRAPETMPTIIDKAEFEADYKARYQLESPIRDLNMVLEKLQDTKTLLDHDNFNASIAYYRYIKFLAQQNEPGTTSIHQDLKKHYQSRGKTTSDTSSNTPDDQP